MKRSICSILLILLTIRLLSQTWVLEKQYKDEWGDATGKKAIKQTVEGSLTWMDYKLRVEISRDVPSTNDFRIRCFDLNGRAEKVFNAQIVWVRESSKKAKKEIEDPIVRGDAKIVESKYLFKYKIGEKESSFQVSHPNSLGLFGVAESNSIDVNYTELHSILSSTSAPIKCIISEENRSSGEMKYSNVIRFTLYPANYSQLVR